jgi:hypothetical protein
MQKNNFNFYTNSHPCPLQMYSPPGPLSALYQHVLTSRPQPTSVPTCTHPPAPSLLCKEGEKNIVIYSYSGY